VITNDKLEIIVADYLDRKKIFFVHESQNNGSSLDFYLPDYDVYIEVKRFYSDRALRQLQSRDNVILIQGIQAIKFLETL
jgi:hypothetical protein